MLVTSKQLAAIYKHYIYSSLQDVTGIASREMHRTFSAICVGANPPTWNMPRRFNPVVLPSFKNNNQEECKWKSERI
jgi:hypothetical protein